MYSCIIILKMNWHIFYYFSLLLGYPPPFLLAWYSKFIALGREISSSNKREKRKKIWLWNVKSRSPQQEKFIWTNNKSQLGCKNYSLNWEVRKRWIGGDMYWGREIRVARDKLHQCGQCALATLGPGLESVSRDDPACIWSLTPVSTPKLRHLQTPKMSEYKSGGSQLQGLWPVPICEKSPSIFIFWSIIVHLGWFQGGE